MKAKYRLKEKRSGKGKQEKIKLNTPHFHFIYEKMLRRLLCPGRNMDVPCSKKDEVFMALIMALSGESGNRKHLQRIILP